MGNSHISKVTPLNLVSSPELKLWRAVLAAAAEDAVSEADMDIKGNMRYVRHKKEDRDYFLNPTRSFYTVCRNAGYDPEYVIRKMRKKLCSDQLYVQNAKVTAFVKFLKTSQKNK